MEPKDKQSLTELTADSIRQNGLSSAEHIRNYAKHVREEGEKLAAYAEEVANEVTRASSQAADRVAGYMQRCEDARKAIEQHRELLTRLPEPEPEDEKATQKRLDPARDLAKLEATLLGGNNK